jgi:hydroxymethylglutaryl-CoA synthase
MSHAYDFYKPNLSSPYPVVDGNLSVECYTSALDTCYTQYCKKSQMNNESHQSSPNHVNEINMNTFVGIVFHTPYVKLTQKSFSRLFLHDLTRKCSYLSDELIEKYKYDNESRSMNNVDEV